MGHVEPDGEAAATRAAALSEAHPVWSLWRELKKEFSLWRAPASWLGTPGSWTSFGNDFVSGLRRNDSTRRAFELIDQAPEQFDNIRSLALLNQRRHEHMFQLVALIYVSVPLTILLGLAEVMPDGLITIFQAHQMLIWQLAAPMTLAVVVYLIGVWRARQLASVLELWRIERGAS